MFLVSLWNVDVAGPPTPSRRNRFEMLLNGQINVDRFEKEFFCSTRGLLLVCIRRWRFSLSSQVFFDLYATVESFRLGFLIKKISSLKASSKELTPQMLLPFRNKKTLLVSLSLSRFGWRNEKDSLPGWKRKDNKKSWRKMKFLSWINSTRFFFLFLLPVGFHLATHGHFGKK